MAPPDPRFDTDDQQHRFVPLIVGVEAVEKLNLKRF